MRRRCRIQLLLAVLLTFQAAVFFVTRSFDLAWLYPADHGGDRDTANETVQLSTFLADYEKYCRSQLIPNASNISADTVNSSNLCPCVPDTLGKCLYLF